MATVRTLEARRFDDSWSFRGLGRWRYVHTVTVARPSYRLPMIEADGTPREEAPVAPGEPRG